MKCKLETFKQSTSSKVIKPQKHRLWFQVSNGTSTAFLFEFPLNETAFSKSKTPWEKMYGVSREIWVEEIFNKQFFAE